MRVRAQRSIAGGAMSSTTTGAMVAAARPAATPTQPMKPCLGRMISSRATAISRYRL